MTTSPAPLPRLGGRPEIGPAINVRLPTELLAALDRRAAAEGVTRAALIRRCIEHALLTTP